MDGKKLIEEGKRLYPDVEKWFPGFSWDGLEARMSGDMTIPVKSEAKRFSLHFLSEQGSPGQTSYNTLAEAINAYQSMWDGTDFSILSLKFDGEIIAEDEALTDLLPSWEPGDGLDIKPKPRMKRKEFEKALDSYEESGLWDPYDVHSSDLADKDTRDFLWELMTEGFKLLPKYDPPKREGPPAKLDMSRCAVMNREVQELKARGDGE